MHILFLSCLKATEMIEKKLHFQLSWREELQLKVHKMMCDACTNYEKQSISIERGLKEGQKKTFTAPELDELKQRISKKLKNSK